LLRVQNLFSKQVVFLKKHSFYRASVLCWQIFFAGNSEMAKKTSLNKTIKPLTEGMVRMLNNMVGIRDLSDLLKDPQKPLTEEQKEHFDEYMSFKNKEIAADRVDISDEINNIIADFDSYMGFTENKV